MMPQSVKVFMGGTFDPIHNGHLRTALEIQQWLGVEQVTLMPSKAPVHRQQPLRSGQQRLDMVRLAVANEPALLADDREVISTDASYTVLTLESLRRELGETAPICMLLGMDAYLSLPHWDRWQELLTLCHIVVVKRPGWTYEPCEQMAQLSAQHATEEMDRLLQSPAGCVIFRELTPLGISATQIRALINAGRSPRYLIPDAVWDYIQHNQLYSEQKTEGK
ncbi:nicotinate-nucleotide adenylyltransferase [Amphritea sp. 1_MG-2023]|uniref:nicotinate-nucleotide adenylyltransferase n=1 Tax=Amphritea sp. 1_MG-2023 TaxID=3062670 RepID=UPI0026E3F876|nr:nicotinate-nucleotide adenylyltransferase [Amphritea sp. 1_MG-2023]MDO6563268.1 nicotinate-nucleotide adenylyltransferase [Amphritea sp. 1_MG-2023]